jgi:hypothetical protein
MKMVKKLFQLYISNPVRRRDIFSEALSEAFLDFFKEMGYTKNNEL